VKAVREIVLQVPLHLLLDLVDPVVIVRHAATVSPWVTAKSAVELAARPIRTCVERERVVSRLRESYRHRCS
jgi:hypothetical protein